MSRLRIGVPTNERIYPSVMHILRQSGMEVSRGSKDFFAHTSDIQFIFARMSEIVRLIKQGHAQGGFVTEDYWFEACADDPPGARWPKGKPSPRIRKVFPTRCRSRLVFVADQYARRYWIPSEEPQTIQSIVFDFFDQTKRGPVIATRFPKITKTFLATKGKLTDESLHEHSLDRYGRPGKKIKYLAVGGSEELYLLLGVADFAVTHIETGETLRHHELYALETLLRSHLVFVGDNVPGVGEFAERLSFLY